MTDKFHLEIQNLKKITAEMGHFSMKMFTDSLMALKNLDEEKAKDVYLRKEKLLEYNKLIEEETIRILSLFQPVAGDLRTITCISQMNTSFYRLGRNAKEISNFIEFMPQFSHLGIMNSICHMAGCVLSMLSDCLYAFENEDAEIIKTFSGREQDIDNLQKTIFRESITYMMEDNSKITACTEYVMASRILERMGDHACLMGEKIYFMIKGQMIEIN
ncbi:phosphate signaling complex protein PhoU [Methanomicrobium antiquum]|uniref:Phosphate-specific transport system accessory protein PhoU n=1 Tax=Methanomicrobium antiquum TaxID=487686 RepID=A0AAF0FXD0_9EURY|nr:phosphate signaling complex protein PhoU [Methanomicrobium antiquum]MDD3976632.1 phosphate signaling complex protein PhoU [Methanomicrobium sp.]WFN37700.1 phosphate signaling complex protein PhoU [Methanomicrobium antiquum]